MGFILVFIVVWLLIGFLARGFYRYRTLTNLTKKNQGQCSGLSDEHDATTDELGKFKHEFVGFILFLCGLAGFLAVLTYEVMEPDEKGNISIRFIF